MHEEGSGTGPVTTRSCALCGVTEECPENGMPSGWSFTVENGRTDYLCEKCARENIRSIEAKLPEEYW